LARGRFGRFVCLCDCAAGAASLWASLDGFATGGEVRRVCIVWRCSASVLRVDEALAACQEVILCECAPGGIALRVCIGVRYASRECIRRRCSSRVFQDVVLHWCASGGDCSVLDVPTVALIVVGSRMLLGAPTTPVAHASHRRQHICLRLELGTL
jgi:hypothetical protein